MAIIVISEEFLDDTDSMVAMVDHFGRLKEIRYLRNPFHGTRTYYVDSDKYKPSEQICPTLTRDINGNVIVLNEN